MDNEVGTWHETSFYDNQGNLVRFRGHYSGTDNLYNPENPDVVLSGPFSVHVESDPRTGEESIFGVAFNITVPGYGAVFHESGRTFPSGRTVGKHTTFNPEALAEFCAMLAGG